jgi:hypothetical protein
MPNDEVTVLSLMRSILANPGGDLPARQLPPAAKNLMKTILRDPEQERYASPTVGMDSNDPNYEADTGLALEQKIKILDDYMRKLPTNDPQRPLLQSRIAAARSELRWGREPSEQRKMHGDPDPNNLGNFGGGYIRKGAPVEPSQPLVQGGPGRPR